MFFKMFFLPIYTPSRSLWKFPLLHILANTYHLLNFEFLHFAQIIIFKKPLNQEKNPAIQSNSPVQVVFHEDIVDDELKRQVMRSKPMFVNLRVPEEKSWDSGNQIKWCESI